MADKQQQQGQKIEPSRQRERQQQGTSEAPSGELARQAQQPQGLQTRAGGGGGLLGGSPISFMRRMFEDMDRLFGDFGLGTTMPTLSSMASAMPSLQTWAPQVEIFQRDDELVVRADLPGINVDDVSVRVDDDRLVVEGERRVEREGKEGEVFQSERFYGKFARSIALPRGVDPSSINARFDNGVLEINMKLPAQPKRTIEIRSASPQPQQPQQQARQEGGAPPTDRNGPAPTAPSRH